MQYIHASSRGQCQAEGGHALVADLMPNGIIQMLVYPTGVSWTGCTGSNRVAKIKCNRYPPARTGG